MGKKLKNRKFAPTCRRKKQAGLGQKAEKQNICSNRKKGEASRIGAKSRNRGKSPNAKKKEASWIGGKVEKQNICSNRKKKEASWIGAKSRKIEYLLQQEEKKRKAGRSKETEKRRIAPRKK